jgi:hypothetical protein
VVNALGTAALVGCYAGAPVLGPRWFGAAAVAGQPMYSAVSVAVLVAYTSARETIDAIQR